MATRPSRRRPIRFRVGRARVYDVAPYPSSNQYVVQVRRGFEQIERNLRDFIQHVGDVEVQIMEEAMEMILVRALMYVPVQTGALRDSAFLETRELAAGPLTEIGFARAGHPWYAAYVHEVSYRHAAPTQWKFLQRAIDEVLPAAYDHIKMRHAEITGA
jgi:hypothetical protein